MVSTALVVRWQSDCYSCNNTTDVCVMTADGADQTNLTPNTPSAELYPSWTPDGRIVFMSNRDLSPQGLFSDIYIMDLGGTNVVRLTTDEATYNAYPSVSPDGTRIAYESDREVETGSELYVMSINGQNNIRVTNDLLWNQNPVWSPDGSRLLYAAYDQDGNGDLYVVNGDGTGVTRLTTNAAEDGGRRLGHAWMRTTVPMQRPLAEQLSRWVVSAPRGTTPVTNAVLFAANSFNCDACLETGLYTVSFDGANLTPLPLTGTFPAWSPTFDRFAYISHGELYIANTDASEPTQITGAVMNLTAPQWNPDGQTIVADCMPFGQHDVCLINAADGTVRNLTPYIVYGTGIAFPYWLGDAELVLGQTRIDRLANITGLLPRVGRASPDRLRLAYVRNQQLFVSNIDGSGEVRLTNDATTKGFPVWSPDSQLIIFTVAPGDGYLYLYAIRITGDLAVSAGGTADRLGPATRPVTIDTWLGYSFAP
jgi:TolB protein